VEVTPARDMSLGVVTVRLMAMFFLRPGWVEQLRDVT
jgi:hypothetical protein